MNSKAKTYLSWSSGKDSAWTLFCLEKEGRSEIVRLITTVNEKFDRVFMHGIHRSLLEEQMKAVGIAGHIAAVPDQASNEEYERVMSDIIRVAEEESIEEMAFGDLFLEDVRKYRERQLAPTRIKPVFPLWGLPTRQLAETMIDAGLKAVITCVDLEHLPAGFIGRTFDKDFLADLPASADPCGERGEFHSFVYGGPMFNRELPVEVTGTIQKDRFLFADIKLAAGQPISV